jgi:4-hydroxybenzoate polyprenyltransferase
MTIGTDVPLIVDLDGTILLTDSLQESFVRLLFRNPMAALGSLASLPLGRGAFKRSVNRHRPLAHSVLPQRRELVEFLKAQKSENRKIHLLTAADQHVAEEIASGIGIFDSVAGSDGKNNLKGENKLAWLREHLPGDFIYAGDSAADLPLFLAARGAILCDAGNRVTRAVERAGVPILARLDSDHKSWRGFLGALRIHQWSKNVLLFLPLFLAHAYTEPANIVQSVLAFCILSVLVSATYLINDLADLDADRMHPTKYRRALASGNLSPGFGLSASVVMIIGAVAAGTALSPGFGAGLVAYLMGTLAYSFGLKRVPFLDVSIVASLFTLRLFLGAAVLNVRQSPWLLAFSLVFFFSLALAKRYAEIRTAATPDSLVRGRGYRGDDFALVLAFGVAGSLASIVILLLFVTSDALVSGAYSNPLWLYAIPAPVFAWQMRIWLFSHRGLLDDDPVIFALRDRASLLLGFLMALSVALAL